VTKELVGSLEDQKITETLNQINTIALIGASAKPERDSFKVMAFLINKGYQVYPVNPVLEGATIMNRKVYACISDIPVSVDMIDVFRQSKFLYDIVVEAKKAGVECVWTQLGVTDVEAESYALENGITMIVNRCPAIEIPRLNL